MPDMPEEGERSVIHLEVTVPSQPLSHPLATKLAPARQPQLPNLTSPGHMDPPFHDHSHDAHNVWPHN